MPGICGFFGTSPQPDATTLAAQMLSRLRPLACPILGQRVDPAGRFALGMLRLEYLLHRHSRPPGVTIAF